MIPKILHYCWFSGEEKPEFIQKCLDSWVVYCPDYKIMEWNTGNFDVHQNKYVSEAYHAKQWAFVTDYARLSILSNYGGIYLDADVELLKNLDVFLSAKSFIGFEEDFCFGPHLIGVECDCSWINRVKLQYEEKSFIQQDGSYDQTTIPIIITNTLMKLYPNITLNNTFQKISDDLVIYPKEYFSPKNSTTRIVSLTTNTHALHHYDASWLPHRSKVYKKIELLTGDSGYLRNYKDSQAIMLIVTLFLRFVYAAKEGVFIYEIKSIIQAYNGISKLKGKK